jgi:hypothetical protein
MLTTDEPQIQGCQIYTKTGKYTKWPQNVLIGQKMYQMAIIWTKIAIKYVHIPTSSNARPFKRYPHWDFCLKIYHLATMSQGPCPATKV